MELDLRSWMAEIDSAGELCRVDGADADSEIGAITDIAMGRIGRPALLFDAIPGYALGHRVLSNALTSPVRVAMALGLDPALQKLDLVKACRGFAPTRLRRIEPRVVSTGPICEKVAANGDVDLTRYPAPRWHEEDGGGYIGTGSVVIERDPDSGWVNLGCYRLMVHGRDKLGVMISQGKQGRIIMEKYWARGERCPIAVSLGHHPLLLLAAGAQIPSGISEYDIAGGIAGAPVDVVTGVDTGLPLPAQAELVVEGYVDPEERIEEGPFGEWTGYYAGGRRPQPVVTVTRLYERRDPIVLGVVPGKPPSDDTYMSTYQTSAAIWNDLDQAGIPGVVGVWGHEASGSRMFVVVAIRQQFAGHAKQAGMIAAHSYAGAYLNKFVVVVDEDIDPSSLDDVIWAMCTRVEAKVDMDVITRSWSSPLDPMAFPPDHPMFNSKTIIDACIPWERKSTFPHVASATPGLRAATIAKWGERLAFMRPDPSRRA